MKLFYKGLVKGKKHKSGRGRNGRICVRRRQGGCSVLYRKINFNLLFNVKDNYQLVRSEYDPNRSSFIGLLYNYKNQKFNYIILPEGLVANELLLNPFEDSFKRKPGFRASLDYFPLGSLVHNISLSSLGYGLLCRSRGSFAKILQKNVKNKYIRIRLPSGEERLVYKFCKATLGTVSNIKKSIKTKNAGWSRRMGSRPSVRGVAMNPVDHPHGGGEGRTSGGRCSVSPWGKLTIGKPTVSRKKKKMVIQFRKQV
jgi:large subunit ribosomal protein L2